MCGIAGWINLKENISSNIHILERMSETLKNRGPDDSGIFLSEHALIAHRRLSVVDPEGGAQPMIREKNGNTYVIAYNGELYNTEDLRVILKERGYSFQSHSDTEVLLTSYIEWGPECVKYLNGIFAFAVWNDKEQSLFLARDRFGVKPLFYSLTSGNLIFGSEVKTLLANPIIKPVVKREGLAEIFALCPSRTPGHGIYDGVHEVKPAHSILFNFNGLKENCYWKLESHPHTDSFDETIEKVGWWVKDAVKRQLVSDVPLCTFLSGGLDSSIITAIASMEFEKSKNTRLDTFSVDYRDNEKYFEASLFQPNSDGPYIKKMSESFNTLHHQVIIDTPELADALKDAVLARDFPGMADVDSSLLLFCREIKKAATVALSGECADEIFGGYPWFHKEELFNAPTFPWARNLDVRLQVLSSDLIELIKPHQYVKERYLETLSQVPCLPGEKPVEKRRREIFYLNIYWFMATLLDRKDRMSMANGLEVRVPFCDHRLVQYVWNIPWDLKMLEGREKGLLRKAMEGILPHDILWRKKSPYPKTFNPSYTAAVKEWLLSLIKDGNSPILPLINKKAVLDLIDKTHSTGSPWFGQLMALPQLFAFLIQVDVWLREYNVEIDI
ncbi:MAG: asparagine synthase (glutamine-hydrolyzing) [Clostridiaceae bacterium]|nr:asparagine synthase (glutamine-hydrolyzing) [Clostridiaceae bacterium]